MEPISRRALVGGIATTAVGATGIAYLQTETVNANVEASNLSISDASHSTENGELTDVVVSVTADITIDSERLPDAYKLSLVGGPAETSPEVLRYTGNTFESSTVQQHLSASLLSHSQLSLSDFQPESGNSISKDVEIGLLLDVKNKENEIIATDSVYTTATITVKSPDKLQVETSLGGSGEITFST